jgi:hypothetical protein
MLCCCDVYGVLYKKTDTYQMIVASHTQHASDPAGSVSAGTGRLPVNYTHKQLHAQQLHYNYINVTLSFNIDLHQHLLLYICYTYIAVLTQLRIR